MMEITLTRWKVPFKLCMLLFLQCRCDVNEHDFFNLARDQNIQRKKCKDAL
jgi:hypothetical protein